MWLLVFIIPFLFVLFNEIDIFNNRTRETMAQLLAKGNLSRKSYTIDIDLNETIKNLQEKIAVKANVPYPLIEIQKLGHKDINHYDSSQTMRDCGVRLRRNVYHVRFRIMGSVAVQIDDNEYIEHAFLPGNSEGFEEYKYRIISALNEDPDDFDKEYTIFMDDNEFIMDDDKFKPQQNYSWKNSRAEWRDVYEWYKVLEIKTKDKGLWYKENVRKIHDYRCELLVFGFVRATNVDVPIVINKICKTYYQTS